ncbi:MAG: hypothetical protein GDA52_11930 [Rhodobacteraceae bacterium]|nr:hypothetical protein [Paracoccaceae bacterium]
MTNWNWAQLGLNLHGGSLWPDTEELKTLTALGINSAMSRDETRDLVQKVYDSHRKNPSTNRIHDDHEYVNKVWGNGQGVNVIDYSISPHNCSCELA